MAFPSRRGGRSRQALRRDRALERALTPESRRVRLWTSGLLALAGIALVLAFPVIGWWSMVSGIVLLLVGAVLNPRRL